MTFESHDGHGTPSNPSAPTAHWQRTGTVNNWASVLRDGCHECGFTARGITPAVTAARVGTAIEPWRAVLRRADAQTRPTVTTWSPVEYACHVRDLCRLVPARLAMMVSFDDPVFDNWDQDRAAIHGDYRSQNPERLLHEFTGWAVAAASVFAAVPDRQWTCSGRRSDGVRFTVLTLGANFLHEIEHHLQDVGGNG